MSVIIIMSYATTPLNIKGSYAKLYYFYQKKEFFLTKKRGNIF